MNLFLPEADSLQKLRKAVAIPQDKEGMTIKRRSEELSSCIRSMFYF